MTRRRVSEIGMEDKLHLVATICLWQMSVRGVSDDAALAAVAELLAWLEPLEEAILTATLSEK